MALNPLATTAHGVEEHEVDGPYDELTRSDAVQGRVLSVSDRDCAAFAKELNVAAGEFDVEFRYGQSAVRVLAELENDYDGEDSPGGRYFFSYDEEGFLRAYYYDERADGSIDEYCRDMRVPPPYEYECADD